MRVLIVDEYSGNAAAPAEERQRATERGWRGYQTTSDGRGLGLSIASMLASSNGGRLALEAGPGGEGLDARCTFPAILDGANR